MVNITVPLYKYEFTVEKKVTLNTLYCVQHTVTVVRNQWLYNNYRNTDITHDIT